MEKRDDRKERDTNRLDDCRCCFCRSLRCLARRADDARGQDNPSDTKGVNPAVETVHREEVIRSPEEAEKGWSFRSGFGMAVNSLDFTAAFDGVVRAVAPDMQVTKL
jgi:hypothetical protein